MLNSKPERPFGIFVGGDVTSGPASVIEAIANGRKAASSIDKYLGGEGRIDEELVERGDLSPYLGRKKGFAEKIRVLNPLLPMEQRTDNFAVIDLGFKEGMTLEEAIRCLK